MRKKYVITNEMIGFSGLNYFFLSEKIVKCIVKYVRFLRISKEQWKQ